jgi:hypothetical protein
MYDLQKKCMENTKYSIPITIEIKMGDIWGYGKKIDNSNINDFIKSLNPPDKKRRRVKK